MKYILKKELPWIEVWTIFEESIDQPTYSRYKIESIFYVNKSYTNEHPDFFEEVKEVKSIYDLKVEDTYWAINYPNKIIKYTSESWSFWFGCHTYCFPTEREAKRNKLLRELATREKWLPNKDELYINITWDWISWYSHKYQIVDYHSWLVFRNKEEYDKWITPENADLLFKL